MAVEPPAGDAWYLRADDYWVPAEQAGEYPVRQGDLFKGVDLGDGEWYGHLLIHPTCELSKRSVERVQVARVHPLSALPDPKQAAAVTAGFEEKDLQVRPAFAHTFFLAPVPDATIEAFREPMFVDLRAVALHDRTACSSTERIGALTHDARVSLIRRKLYFRYRLSLPFEEVRRLEAGRIGHDQTFAGPRPEWAEGG